MKKHIFLFITLTVASLTGCKMAGETKSGWYTIQLKDESGELSGKTLLQVNGEALSRGLHQAVMQYHTNYKQSSTEKVQELFVIRTNRRKAEDYIIVTTADENEFRFPVYPGGLIFDMPAEPGDEKNSSDEENSSIVKLIELMSQYEELKISQGSYYFTINTAGFTSK